MDMKNKIEVRRLETEPEKQGLFGWIKSKQVLKSAIGIAIGAIGGFIYIYITNEYTLDAVPKGDIIQNVIFGALLGFFFTNNPCARNKC